jgi:uncharacterized delta-60 repeat protein
MTRRTNLFRLATPLTFALALLALGWLTRDWPVRAADEVTGTVLTLDGRGVPNARVTATVTGQEPRYAQTNPAGRFRFPDLPTGQSCTFAVTHKVLSFDQRVLTISGAADLTFSAKPTQTNFALDQSFGTGGKVVTDMGGNDRALSVFGQADGKIVVIGLAGNQGAIARYLADGSLDQSFGTGGKVLSPNLIMSVDLNIKPGALQPDNKIVIAGRNASSDFMVERRNPDGGLDVSFGGGGVVTLEFGPGSADQGKAVAIQPDGKIVVAGTTNFGTTNAGIGVTRFNSDGSVDTGFGTAGKTIVDTAGVDDPRAIAFQPDGKILIAGSLSSSRPMLVRLKADGSRDTAFGDNGIATSTHNGGGYDLELQRDGKIVLIGEGLARFGSDGLPDTVFNGPTGAVGVQSTELQTVALRADGMILAGGRSFITASDGSFGLALVHPFTGQVVRVIETDVLSQRFDDPKDILVQPDGRIVMVGYTVPVTTSDFALVRYASF